jgi:hypothetical protein
LLSKQNADTVIGYVLRLSYLKTGADDMDEVLTVAEIESRFIAEWILVEDPEMNDSFELQSGKVRYHSKDRDEVYRKAIELKPSRFAVHYTGKIPKDAAVVL